MMNPRFGILIRIAGVAGVVLGEPALAQNLDVKGTTTGEGNASFFQDVAIGGAVSIGGTVTAQGAATFNNASTFNNAATFNGPVSGIAQVPTGTVTAFAGSVAPSGYLICNGAVVSRTTYAALFAVIGTTYGAGDGITTFNLPDLRGRAPIGAGQGSGLTNRTLGASGGEENHTLSVNEMPSHSHVTALADPFGWTPFGSSAPTTYTNTIMGSWNNSWGSRTAGAGSGWAHNNMQPWRALNFIIKM